MIRFLKENSLFKNFLTMFTGTVLAQVVTVMMSPVLSRLYSPEDFGLLALYVALCGVCVIFATGNYEMCILLPKYNKAAYHIVIVAVFCSISFCSLLLLGALFYHEEILLFLNNDNFSVWLYILPFGVFITSLVNIFTYWSNRNKLYFIMSKVTIIRSIATVTINVICGVLALFSGGLIIGTFVGGFSGFLKLFKTFRSMTKQFTFSPKISILYAKKYKKFPLFNMWAMQMNNISGILPIFILGWYFSSEIVGLYSMAYRCTSLPMGVIGSSIGSVYLQRCSELRENRKTIAELTYKIFSKLVIIASVPFSILFAFGDLVFVFVLGDSWKIAGEYASLLSPWLALVFVCSPLSSLMIVLEKQKQNFCFQLCMMIFRGIALICAGLVGYDSCMAIALYSIVGFSMWICLIGYIHHILYISLSRAAWMLFVYLFCPSIFLYYIRIWLGI